MLLLDGKCQKRLVASKSSSGAHKPRDSKTQNISSKQKLRLCIFEFSSENEIQGYKVSVPDRAELFSTSTDLQLRITSMARFRRGHHVSQANPRPRISTHRRFYFAPRMTRRKARTLVRPKDPHTVRGKDELKPRPR